jgi:hypothetical protein
MRSGGVLMAQVGCFVISELWLVVPSGAEQKVLPSSTGALMVTWPSCWVARGAEWAGVRLSSRRHILMNARARRRVTLFAVL